MIWWRPFSQAWLGEAPPDAGFDVRVYDIFRRFGNKKTNLQFWRSYFSYGLVYDGHIWSQHDNIKSLWFSRSLRDFEGIWMGDWRLPSTAWELYPEIGEGLWRSPIQRWPLVVDGPYTCTTQSNTSVWKKLLTKPCKKLRSRSKVSSVSSLLCHHALLLFWLSG